jgi:hypothetical protein
VAFGERLQLRRDVDRATEDLDDRTSTAPWCGLLLCGTRNWQEPLWLFAST